ncbi:MAG: ATP-binding protein [Aquabacterium sp.]|uniref:ATP-binding protein n=1 Tax=Aquabacterium sp. TaxID=1872578 RepID=UPI002724ECFA|nr:ATP-binding protein [Aquabacterium sp.]MDO9005040.1 ATP-binding protein [Aquabacterium sp.]
MSASSPNPPVSAKLLYPRHLASPLQEALLDTPAVLVNGPRQCGKTTLVQQLAGDMAYYTLDDTTLLAAVRQDPLGFARRLDRAIIDEVQRAPELLMALKFVIDQDRRPGRFLLTGSANLMALPQVADSLAGRMAVHTLLPLSQAELQRRPNDFLQRAQTQDWPTQVVPPGTISPDIVADVLAGGYPEMRQRTTPARRQAWARAYIQALIERDVRDVAHIEHLSQMPHLLAIAAAHCGQLFNASQIGGQLGLDSKTVDKYLGVLEKLFLVQRLPAWSRNELNRLVKTPKMHFLDAGLQSTLVRLTPELIVTQRDRWGATLETWVHAELRKAMSRHPGDWFISYYRDKDQVEVDFILESPLRQVIGIEVKAAASVNASDFKGLKKLQLLTGEDFISGLVLYNGDQALSFGDGMWAVPFAAL